MKVDLKERVLTKVVEKRRTDLPEQETISCGHRMEDDSLCDFSGTAQAVNLHRWKMHQKGDSVRKYVVTNECPMCEQRFEKGKLDLVKRHLVRANGKFGCPNVDVDKKKKYGTLMEVERIEAYACAECGYDIETHEEIQSHLAWHVARCSNLGGRTRGIQPMSTGKSRANKNPIQEGPGRSRENAVGPTAAEAENAEPKGRHQTEERAQGSSSKQCDLDTRTGKAITIQDDLSTNAKQEAGAANPRQTKKQKRRPKPNETHV
jgi:hypothetical protein